MSVMRGLLAFGLATMMLLASGLEFEELSIRGDADSTEEEPASDLNLGDCLRKTDRSQWPPAYAAICSDLLTGIEAASDEPARNPPATPRERAARATIAKTIPSALSPAPRPVARPAVPDTARETPRIEPPAPSCTIGAAGKVTVGQGKAARVGPARFISSSPTNRSTAGVALGVPAACRLESPVEGRIVFAGEFKGYRSVVIVELPKGERLVIAGLGPLKIKRGARVARGDILGASSDGRAPALEAAFGGDDPSLVFFDMRNRSGKAEALPWFAAAS